VAISLDDRVTVPPDVLCNDLGGEMVILNLKTQTYFGLDASGVRMWKALTESATIQQARDRLMTEYDVDAGTLQHDMVELIETLVEHGLVATTAP
jgi:hypothetical protein